MIRIFKKKPGRSKELCTSPKIGSEKKKQQQQKRTKERKGKKEQSEIMTGQIMVCVKKGRERERDRGEEKHAEKVKDFGSPKQVIFPKLKLNFAGDCFWLLILFSYEKMWEPSTFLNFRLSLVYLLSGTCFHILNHAIF